MAVDESFKRPGSIPFKWEVQPGIPKPEPQAARVGTALPPRLAPPPAARVVSGSTKQHAASFAAASRRRRSSSDASCASFLPSHRRSMSARFATSLVLPFTRRGRSRTRDDAEFCLLFGDGKFT